MILARRIFKSTNSASNVMLIFYDKDYTITFHSPGIEPWIFGFLKQRVRERGSLGRVLDVGCGLGLMGFLLCVYLNNVESLECVEISHEKVDKVRALGLYDRIYLQDFLDFRFPVKYDTIIALEVLHSLDKRALDKIEEVGHDNSTVILAMPYLPRGVSVEDLIDRGYFVYRYLLRGLILVDLKNFKVLASYQSRFLRLLPLFLIVFWTRS